jgi:hypothetical protein
MLTRCLVLAVALAGCASAPSPPPLPPIEKTAGPPEGVRMLLGHEEATRLSRAGIMDPSSPSGLTDRFRYRAAVEDYVAYVLRAYGLCPRGHANLDVVPAQKPFDTAITLTCLPP